MNKANKMAYRAIGETCPVVDEAFYELQDDLENILEMRLNTEEMQSAFKRCIESVKTQTGALRDALVASYQDQIEMSEDYEYQLDDIRESMNRE